MVADWTGGYHDDSSVPHLHEKWDRWGNQVEFPAGLSIVGAYDLVGIHDRSCRQDGFAHSAAERGIFAWNYGHAMPCMAAGKEKRETPFRP